MGTVSITASSQDVGKVFTQPTVTEEEKVKIKEIMTKSREFIQGIQKYSDGTENYATKFNVVFGWQWKLELEGIDAFLVKKVEFPKYVREPGEDLHDILKKLRKLTVYLYEAVTPSTRNQVEELLLQTSIAPKNATLHYLNKAGESTSTRRFIGIRVEEAEFAPLDYDSKKPLEIKLVLSYQEEEKT